MLITMSTQLLSGPSSGPKDVNPFLDAAMAQVTNRKFSVIFSLYAFHLYLFCDIHLICRKLVW